MSDRLGGREGGAVDRSCLQSCPRLHNVGKTRDRCVQVTEGWHGGRVVDGRVKMVDAPMSVPGRGG